MIQEQLPVQRSSHCLAIVVLLIILVFAVLYFATHSEQKTYQWLEGELTALSIDQSTVTAIYVVIFSQVIVCGPCRQDMKLWQRGLRSAAKTNRVFLSIWDIVYGKGFNPATYQAGTGTPITIDAIRKVPIIFVP